MSEAQIKGWCPGAHRPMLSGDGLIVRIRPRMSRISAEQAVAIADLAQTHGNGLIDFSARANIQLRGVTAQTHEPLLEALAALDLVDADAETEARRNLIITPFWRDGDDTQALALRLEEALEHAPALPGKFGFAVDTGAKPALSATSADIRLERGAGGQLILRADGAADGLPVTIDNAAEHALALAHWFLQSGGAPDGRGRMSRHLQSGAGLPCTLAGSMAPAVPLAMPKPGRHPLGLLVGLAFGQLEAANLALLAQQATGGAIRITPWRMVLLEGISDGAALSDHNAFILSADDPRLRVHVCTGAPGCLQASVATRDVADALAPHLPAGMELHVSGCSKGCAHPASADLTLTGNGGMYSLIRNGKATDQGMGPPIAPSDLIADPAQLFRSH